MSIENHQVGTKQIVVLRTPGLFHSRAELEDLISVENTGVDTSFIVLRPGESLEFLGDDAMRELGWERCAKNGEDDLWTITLNRYERDNLLSVFALGGYVGDTSVSPFTMLNSGDWFGQVPQKLMSQDDWNKPVSDLIHPNVGIETMRNNIGKWIAGIVVDVMQDKQLMAELPAMAEAFDKAAPYVGGKHNALMEIAKKLQPLIDKR